MEHVRALHRTQKIRATRRRALTFLTPTSKVQRDLRKYILVCADRYVKAVPEEIQHFLKGGESLRCPNQESSALKTPHIEVDSDPDQTLRYDDS
jgi:hypothetical protein